MFGPSSLSKIRLWSCEEANGIKFFPSQTTSIEASSPTRHSSIITLFPAPPKILCSIMEVTASRASCCVLATMTPFPCASPSALTTMGISLFLIYSLAFSELSKISQAAVGTPDLIIICFANTLLASSRATRACGPNILKFSFSNSSTIPAAKGASGPTTVRSIFLSFAKSISLFISLAFISTHLANCPMPAFPGAAKISFTFLD